MQSENLSTSTGDVKKQHDVKPGSVDTKKETESRSQYLKGHVKSFASRFRKPNADMIKCSLVCGIVGSMMFCMGFVTLINSAITALRDKNLAKSRFKDAKALMYQNIVPFIELIAMIGLFVTVHRLVSNKFTSTAGIFFMSLGCIALCIAAMFTICLSLRMLGFRKDCNYQSINFPASMNAESVVVFPCFSDKEVSNYPHDSFAQSVIDVIFGKVFAVLFVLIGTAQLISIPFRLLVDACSCIKNKDIDVLKMNQEFFRNSIKSNFGAAYHLFFYNPIKKDIFGPYHESSCCSKNESNNTSDESAQGCHSSSSVVDSVTTISVDTNKDDVEYTVH